MVEITLFAAFLLFLGLLGLAEKVWIYIQSRHEKAAAQRIRARRMAEKMPREKSREDYWAA